MIPVWDQQTGTLTWCVDQALRAAGNSSRLVALPGRAHGDVDWATVHSHLARFFDANPHIA